MNQRQSGSLPAGFMVLHGNRLEDLRDLLVSVLQAQPLGVLEPEVMLVQSNGIKHWLEIALAHPSALGICAATQMVLPSAYLWQVYRSVLGRHAVPAHMPFDKASMVWRLVRLLPQWCDSQPIYAPLQRYLGQPPQPRKLYQLAMQLADVFDGYQSYRADWLADWAAGREALAPEHAWQAQLWRDLRQDVAHTAGPDWADASRAAVHERFLAAMTTVRQTFESTGQRPPGLPRRLVVFGVSSLPMQAVQALAALGQVCQVLMLVHNPCRYFWGDVVQGHDALRAQVRRRQPLKTALQTAPSHPLLASWGKQGRDHLHLLDGFDAPEQYRHLWSRVDVFVDPAPAEADTQPSQLALLQSGVLNLLPEPPEPQPMADDGSIVFVSAHSALRELEVLHDRLLAWFETQPELHPRDVMVMVPDMATFAPLIQAVFGRWSPGQPGFVPFSVADTTARTSPLVQALETLLNLPSARLSLADWAGLFEVAAVRQRFGLTEADVAQLQDWLAQAGVRWGLDGDHRLQWGLPADMAGLAQNTWAFGLRRLLLGYAMGDASGGGLGGDGDAAHEGAGAVWAHTTPQPAWSGLDAPLVAALLQWLQATEQTLAELSQAHTPAQWGAVLQALVARFFSAADDADERTLAQVLQPLQTWLTDCAQAQLDSPLPLEVVREHWLDHIEAGSLQQRFFGGGVQFGTLMPMRAIPFSVICLLGMNDGDYPRAQSPRDFDLMAQSWRAGDRSRREDDRYLFLEAMLCARQTLYVSWQGHSATDHSARPASVLVAQLLDHVNALWSPPHQPQVQPLQPFSPAYFELDSGFETFDGDWARSLSSGHLSNALSSPEPLTPPGPLAALLTQTPNVAPADTVGAAPSALTLEDLQRLLRAPVEVFFRSHLQITLDALSEAAESDEPFDLNPLAAHQAGAALLSAPSPAQGLLRLQGTGELPLAAGGQRTAQRLLDVAQQVQQRRALWQARFTRTLPAQAVALTFEDGSTLTGTLDGLLASDAGPDAGPIVGPCLQLASRPGAVLHRPAGLVSARGHVLTSLWARHLAGCASGLALTSVQLGVDGQVRLPALPARTAHAMLARLLAAHRQAWVSPLPVACKTAFSFLAVQAANANSASDKPPKNPHEAAQATFDGGFTPGEWAQSPYLQRAFEGYADLQADLPHWADTLYGDLCQHLDLSPEVGA